MKKDVKEIIAGGIISFAGIIISKIATYLWRIIVARHSVEGYGLVSLFIAISGVLTLLATMGLPSALGRFIPYYIGKNNIKKIYDYIYSYLNLATAVTFSSSVLVYLLSENLALWFFNDPSTAYLFKLAALFTPVAVLKAFSGTILISNKNIKEQTFAAVIVDTISKLIFALFFIYYLHEFLYAGVYSYILGGIFSMILLVYFSEKKTFSVIKGLNKYYSNHKNKLKEMFIYSFPLFIQGLFISIIGWTDSIMIGKYLNVENVGVYNAAYPTARLMMMITSSLLAVFFPIIVGHYARKEIKEIRYLYKLLIKWIFVLNYFIFLVVFMYTEEIISILFGNNYLDATLSTKFLIVSLFIFSISNIGFHIITMKKDTKILLYISMVSATGNVILNYFLIPVYGILGGAIATSFSYLFDSVSLQFFADKYLKTIPYTKNMIYTAIVGFLSIYGINKSLHTLFPFFNYYIGVLFVALSGIVYLSILLLFKIITREEITKIIIMIKNKL